MTAKREISEAWFERYLRETGHAGGDEHAPDLGIRTRPDYLISKGGASAVCEVKEFATSALHVRIAEPGSRHGFTMDPTDVHKAPARRIRDAARQLEPLRSGPRPLVVVLANPRGIWLGVDLPEMAAGARRFPFLSGVAILTLRERARDTVDQWLAENGEAVRRANPEPRDHAAALFEALGQLAVPEGEYVRVDVIHTESSQTGAAVPLSRKLFDGPQDKHWHADSSGLLDLA